MMLTVRRISFAIFLGITILLPRQSFSQITVTANDLLSLIGKSETIEADTTGSVAVNVGNAGANQLWDIASIPLQSRAETIDIISPAGTPFEADFPDANLAQRFMSEDPQAGTGEIYFYMQVSNDALIALGGAGSFGDTSLVLDNSPSQLAPLPLTFGSSWADATADTTEFSGFMIIDSTYSNNMVDAWGTVRVAASDYNALRIRTDERTISKTILFGNVVNSDTTQDISYFWITKGVFNLASITSMDGETNPNFTTASSVSRLASTTTGVQPGDTPAELPTTFNLQQNFPNPFNPETQISFSIGEPGRVDLEIFDATGKRVKTLVARNMAAGNYNARWDGTNEAGHKVASGQYVYRLRLNGQVKSKIMTLLK